MKRIVVFLFFFLFMGVSLTSCGQRTVCIITDKKELLVPLKVSKFFGFFKKREIELKETVVSSSSYLIRLLNYPNQEVVLVEEAVGEEIKKNTKNYVPICRIAFDGDNYYVLEVKASFLREEEELIPFIKGWNEGVTYLKDPSVRKLVDKWFGTDVLERFSFFRCKGLVNETKR